MKKILIGIAALFGSSGLMAQTNCSLVATPSSSTIVCGQSVQLNASGAGGAILMSNNFNNGTVGAGWSASASAQFDNPCGTGVDGTTHLWMGGTTAAPRAMTTIPYNIACTGTICFDLQFASGFTSPCEAPDLSTEGVDVGYSTDGGVTWTSIFYFDPTTNAYNNWANYCFTIPAGAVSPNTMFSWSQANSSGAAFDHWGIDNVNITLTGPCATASPYYYSWLPTTGLSNPSIANPVATPTTSITYTLYFTNGIDDTCMATVPVTVNSPTADAGTMQTICLGQSATLSGTGASNLPANTTFSSTTTTSIVDNATVTNAITVSGLPYTTISTTSISQVCINSITHTWDSDMTISLLCPDGTSLELSSGNGGSSDNYTNTCFTPTATNSITLGTAPFTGTFLPEGAAGFNAFNGCTANGQWVLQVADGAAGDVGTINSWNITFVTPAVTTPAWTPVANMTGSNTFNPVVTPTVPGYTQYTITVNGNPGCSATDTVSVFVNQLTGVSVTATSNVLCQSDSTNLNAIGGIIYTWSPAAGLSSTNIANPVATPAVTTNYTVSVSDGNCSKVDSVLITVNPRPATDAGANVAYCLNDSIQLSASGANTYTWLPTTGLSAANVANPISHASTTITYTVTGTTTATGCFRTDTVRVTVNPLPVADAGVDTAFCAGGNVGLNATGGGTYSWLPATNMSNSTVGNPTVNPATSISYSLTVTNSFGCIDRDTIHVTVRPLPNVDAGANGFTCAGTPRQLNATGAVSYLWSPAGSVSNPAISNPTASPAGTTTYTVVGTDAFGCSKSDVVTVGIYTVATVAMSSSAASVCPGSTATLTATGTPTSYTWSPAGTLGSINGPSVAATPTTTTTYTVTYATPGNGCIGRDSITVGMLTLPLANAGSNVDFCPGTSGNLNASGGVSYAWLPVTNLSNPAIANPSANPAVLTIYTVTVTGANGCSDTSSVVVTPRPNPIPGAVSSVATGCIGATGSLTSAVPTVGTAPFSYALNGGAAQASTSFNGLAAGTYTITVTDSFGCHDTISANVGVAPNPVAGSIASTLTACTSATGSLTMQTPGSGTAPFAYSLNGGLPQASPIFSALAVGVYTITVIDANGCTDSDTSSVGQQNPPQLNGLTATNAICTSATGTITVPTPIGGTAPFMYSVNGGALQSSSIINSLIANTYTISVTDANGCTDTDTITVPMIPSTMVLDTALLTSTVCGNTTGVINVQLPTGGTGPYMYSNNGGTTYQSSPLFSNLATGNYPVVVKDANGCTALNSFYIGANILANASFESAPPSGVYPLGVTFTNNSTNANHYIWDFGNGTANAISTNASTTYTAPGTYTVALIAYNNVPTCADTAWTTILVIDPPAITVPNIITPNDDQKNDEFKLIGFNYKSIDVTIFDRWGKKVTSYTGDINATWKPGSDVHEGTYFYVILATSLDDKVTELSGYLTLTRGQ